MSSDAPRLTGSVPHVTVAAMGAAFMALADMSIINVSLSQIRSSFAVSVEQVGWITTSYMIANVVIMPLSGWLQRRFGFRDYFVGSVALFTFASAACGAATHFYALVFWRVVQGIGGGALIPTSQTLLLEIYPKTQHDRASALFGVGALAGPVIGPSLGGWMLEWTTWPWLFWINVPIGFLVAYLCLRHLREPQLNIERRQPDVLGLVLLALGLGSLQYVLEEGNRLDWLQSQRIVFLTFVSIIALAIFISRSLTMARPLVNLRLFADPRFGSAALLNLAVGVIMFGGAYLLSVFCGEVLSYPPKEIGKVLFVGNAIDFIVVPIVAWQLHRFQVRIFLITGVVLLAASAMMSSRLGLQLDFWDLTFPQVVRSVGAGLIYIPITIAALDHLTGVDRATAVALFNLTRELGGSIGTAVLGYVISQRSKLHYDYLADHVSAFRWEFAAELHRYGWSTGATKLSGPAAADVILQRFVQGQSAILAFNDAFFLLFWLMLAVIPFLIRFRNKITSTEVAIH